MTQRVTVVNTSNETGDVIVIKTKEREHNIALRRGESMAITLHTDGSKIELVGENKERGAGGNSRYVGTPQVFAMDPPAGINKGT